MLNIKDMSLSRKLLSGFSIVVVLLAIVGLVGYNGISEINSGLVGIISNDVVMADSVMEMKIAGLTASDSIGEQLLGEADAREQFETSIKNFEEFESKINSMDLNDEEKKDMADIGRLNKNFVGSANELFAVIDAAKLEKNNNINAAMEKFDVDRLKLNEALEEFEVMQSAEMEQAKANAEETAKNASILIVSITIIASIIGFGIGFYISRLITKPVEEVLAGSREISNGKLDVKLINNSRDEIGMLSSTFRNMAKELQEVISDTNNVLAAMSEGDLTKNISVQAKGDFEKITTGIQNMQKSLQKLILSMKNSAEKVASTAQELSASSEEMKASTDQISSTTQDIATGVSSQASKMSEISRAMKEMSESVQQVAVNSQKAADSATNANKTAQEVRVNVTKSATLIKDLDNKSLQIGEIIGVITNIADQTNLLALNAAIEAARAGEHGRGFAVVADEVRKLAEESRGAANQITDLIKGIQQGTKQAVESMEKESVTGINLIATAAADVAAMVQEIAAAAQEQSASVEEVTSSVEDVSAISEESAAGTQETSAAAEEQAATMDQLVNAAQEMAKLSNELQAEVAKFKIDESVEQKHGFEPARVEYKPAPERKTVEHRIFEPKSVEHKTAEPKTAKHKPEGSQKKMKEHSTDDSMSGKDERADIVNPAGSSLADLTK